MGDVELKSLLAPSYLFSFGTLRVHTTEDVAGLALVTPPTGFASSLRLQQHHAARPMGSSRSKNKRYSRELEEEVSTGVDTTPAEAVLTTAACCSAVNTDGGAMSVVGTGGV